MAKTVKFSEPLATQVNNLYHSVREVWAGLYGNDGKTNTLAVGDLKNQCRTFLKAMENENSN
jgi:hypothetical protein